jgi:hypothetical protein
LKRVISVTRLRSYSNITFLSSQIDIFWQWNVTLTTYTDWEPAMCSGKCLRKRKLSIFMVIWKLLYIESIISLKFSWILQINLFQEYSSLWKQYISGKSEGKILQGSWGFIFYQIMDFSSPHQYQITASILLLSIFLMVMSDTWPLDHIMSNKKKTRV